MFDTKGKKTETNDYSLLTGRILAKRSWQVKRKYAKY